MPAPIPLSRPDITEKEIEAVVEVLHTHTLSIGPKVEEFEEQIRKLTQRRHAIGVSSGTAGLHCAMMAAGIAPGDEVITTPFSFVASTNCILYVGARPVFVDIDPKTLNMDVSKVEAAITPKTRGIVAVEVFGHPGGMAEVEQIAQKHDLALIEDACEGLGGMAGKRPIGSFGKASVFGFYPNKQITTGEGGMIVTDDDGVAAACRALRNQGREGMGWLAHQRLGFNYRLSEINAVLGVVQMGRLEEILEGRRRVAMAYMERLMTSRYVILPTVLEDTALSWFVFVVKLSDLFDPADRDAAIHELRKEGIGCNNYFPPIHLQPYMVEQFGFNAGDFPVCEYTAGRTIALPFFGKLTMREIDRVCETLEKVLEGQLMGKKPRF
jgi:perosamine synthetase